MWISAQSDKRIKVLLSPQISALQLISAFYGIFIEREPEPLNRKKFLNVEKLGPEKPQVHEQ